MGSFWVKIGPNRNSFLMFVALIWTKTTMFWYKYHIGSSLHHLMVKMCELLAKRQYFESFLFKIGDMWPPGVSIYRDPSYCLVNYFEETLSCFISKVFLWLFCPTKWFKLRSYQQNPNIWGHFWSKYGYLTPCGGHTERYSLLFGDSF